MMMEAKEHEFNCFVTLTYAPEFVPSDGSLSKRPLQLFIKRLREAVAPRGIRYYAVGEYGDQSWRPHYHLVLFGVSPTEEPTIKACWPFGFVCVGTAEPSSMSYCASYVTKKMTNPKDKRLNGRHPEFCLMSRRPGIGHGVVARIVESYQGKRGLAALERDGWISEQVMTEGRKYPLGRYLKGKILDKLGVDPVARKAHNLEYNLDQWEKQMGKSTDEICAAKRNARIRQAASHKARLRAKTI